MSEDVLSRRADIRCWWPWYILAGIWFLDVLESQDRNKPEQNLAELLQKDCANSTS